MSRKDRHWPKPKHYIFDLTKSTAIASYLILIVILAIFFQTFYAVKILPPLLAGQPAHGEFTEGVSVVICARNDRKNLERHLSGILSQDYPEFEVVVLDDHSADGTWEWLNEQADKDSKLHVFRASEAIAGKPGKKWALREAIGYARYDHLLLTDADCRPAGRKWIKTMSNCFSREKEIVLGIGHYDRRESWWNGLLQYETFFTALCYLGFAGAKEPYMGVGRNLGYKKSLFEARSGGITQPGLSSGDDDLLVQQIADSRNTAICPEPESYVYSDPPQTYAGWIRQKTRHYSTAVKYRVHIAFQLALFKASIYTFHLASLALIISNQHVIVISQVYLMRWWLWVLILSNVKKHLGFEQAIYLLPWFEIYFCFFDLWILTRNLIKRNNRWK